MKVNTDGVLLGALANAIHPQTILDIGTGTGVIALMLAQRFQHALIDAVEIDIEAAATAKKNFKKSIFSDRLSAQSISFQDLDLLYPDKKYDLIVSNPPFFTNSFKNPDKQKELARHTSSKLFDELIFFAKSHLQLEGVCCFILPVEAAQYIISKGKEQGLNLQELINVRSFKDNVAHRQIIKLGFGLADVKAEFIDIYREEKVYSEEYREVLKDFLTIF